jgi:hypothetical protein
MQRQEKRETVLIMDAQLIALILQLRLMLDERNDRRSLVAVVAQFEREAENHIGSLGCSIVATRHNGNAV